MGFEMANHSVLISLAASFEKLEGDLALCTNTEEASLTFFALAVV